MESSPFLSFSEKFWDTAVCQSLCDFVAIPNLSPIFDKDWAVNGNQEKAVNHIFQWTLAQKIEGLKAQIVTLPNLTPMLVVEVAAFKEADPSGNILMYGHFDKQPPFQGWREGLAPTKPVIEGDLLYGRGAADDGYAIYASIGGIKACQTQNIPHSRIVILIEGSEESSSPHLAAYFEHLSNLIKTPDVVVCLDSGCGDYERFWVTTSLRGATKVDLSVQILQEGVHSGDASGVVPDSFRILRILLERLEDSKSGKILLPELADVAVPQDKIEEAKHASEVVGDLIHKQFPFVQGGQPTYVGEEDANFKRYMARVWGNVITVTGGDGFPPIASAGNVLRTSSALRLSIRTAPTINGPEVAQKVKSLLEQDTPYGAQVNAKITSSSNGWCAPAFDEWLSGAMEDASKQSWGKPPVYFGEGGSIPFMAMLNAKFPKSQFVVAGLLGPGSNAHGPNESMHIPTFKRLTASLGIILAKHAVKK